MDPDESTPQAPHIIGTDAVNLLFLAGIGYAVITERISPREARMMAVFGHFAGDECKAAIDRLATALGVGVSQATGAEPSDETITSPTAGVELD